jgi:hypothetical protein
MEKLERILRGLDFLTTIRADQWIEAPPELLGPSMEGFREMVVFVGAPLYPAVGNADTIMERLEDIEIGKEVRTRLVAFANVSAAPIQLKGTGALAGYYDLYVTLSPTAESPGKTVFYSENGVSGRFESELSLSPMFELRPLGGGESIFVDTGETPIPGFPMRLGTTGGSWSVEPPIERAVRHFAGQSIFYTSEVLIIANERAPLDQLPPVAACVKRQAEFVTPDAPGKFARINFPNPHRFANLRSYGRSGGG